MSIMGTRVKRVEDPLFLSRGATYTEDLADARLDGALHLTLVRSPVAHGLITSIDVTAARQAPGVVAVVTGADIDLPPPKLFPTVLDGMERPWLATVKVRFVGEPVAAVLTEGYYEGPDATELVEVDYDPLPAVVDLTMAASDQVLLFEDVGTNVVATFDGPEPSDATLFQGCEVVVTREIVNQRLAAAPLEGRAAAAAWDDSGRLTLWCSTQNAQAARATVAHWLAVDPGLVRVITPDVGGGFGAKIGADPEFGLVAWLARYSGRPVRWSETRSENMTGMVHGRAQRQTITIGGTREGDVLAYRLKILADAGAYPHGAMLLPSFTRRMAQNVYDIPKVESSATSVVTTTTSIGAYRGAGRPEAVGAIERAMDLFAAEIGMDPAQVRKQNVVRADAFPFTTKSGVDYDSGDYAEAIDRVLEAGGYAQLREEQRTRRERGDAVQLGLGISAYVEITGGGALSEDASVEVHPNGTVTVLTGTSPQGQGHATAWAMLASDQLKIPIEKITVVHGDTDVVPRGAGTMGSRSLQTGGVAVQKAAGELVELAKQRAADILEADPTDLELSEGGLRVRGTHVGMSLAVLAEAEQLRVDSRFEGTAPTFPFGAHLAVVEVDVETGKATVDRIITVDDAGTVLNPLLAEGQRHGGIAQGIAQALLEEVLYDEDGNPLTATFAQYGIPSAADLPSFTLLDMETPTPLNPLGAKGIGESGTIGATPAVQSAVVDAVSYLGVRHIDMPCTPDRVWAEIQAARSGERRPVEAGVAE